MLQIKQPLLLKNAPFDVILTHCGAVGFAVARVEKRKRKHHKRKMNTNGNGLSKSETDPLNHKRLDFTI